jgi:hypothetical protein
MIKELKNLVLQAENEIKISLEEINESLDNRLPNQPILKEELPLLERYSKRLDRFQKKKEFLQKHIDNLHQGKTNYTQRQIVELFYKEFDNEGI